MTNQNRQKSKAKQNKKSKKNKIKLIPLLQRKNFCVNADNR